jgi:hypothetical protein
MTLPNNELPESQTSSSIRSSYVLSQLNEYQRSQLLPNACENCPNALWKMQNKQLVAFCRITFQESYRDQKNNQIIVQMCDGVLQDTNQEQQMQDLVEDIKEEIDELAEEIPEVSEALEELNSFDPSKD